MFADHFGRVLCLDVLLSVTACNTHVYVTHIKAKASCQIFLFSKYDGVHTMKNSTLREQFISQPNLMQKPQVVNEECLYVWIL